MSIQHKKMILGGMVVCIFSLYFLGCKEKERVISPPPGEQGEKLIWSTHKGRPTWISQQPRTEGEYYLFVGESEKFAIEKGARDAAYRDAIKQVGIFIKASVGNLFEKLLSSHNLESQIIDKTIALVESEKQVSNVLVKNAKIKEYYEEQRETKSGQIYWTAFALLEVPISSIDEVYKDAANQIKESMMKEYETAKDEKAKEQLKSAMEAFNEAYKKGFVPGE